MGLHEGDETDKDASSSSGHSSFLLSRRLPELGHFSGSSSATDKVHSRSAGVLGFHDKSQEVVPGSSATNRILRSNLGSREPYTVSTPIQDPEDPRPAAAGVTSLHGNLQESPGESSGFPEFLSQLPAPWGGFFSSQSFVG